MTLISGGSGCNRELYYIIVNLIVEFVTDNTGITLRFRVLRV